MIDDEMSFDTYPIPIHARNITEEVHVDVVVVGAGVSGLTAALSAAEKGSKTIVLEKGSTIHYRGGHNAAIASKIQKQAGIQNDKEKIIYTIMEMGAYLCDQRVVKAWADNCDSTLDWLIDMATADNLPVTLDTSFVRDWYFPNYPVMHVFWPKLAAFPRGQKVLCEMLHKNALEKGVEFRFETPAVRLLRYGKNRIHGVIAKNPKGAYTMFKVNKAVVLCSGDYGNDKEMVKKYCRPGIHNLRVQYSSSNNNLPNEPNLNTGDGHKMGMWVGAAIDEAPHCVMLFDYPVWVKDELFRLSRQPWLYVNLNGERFMNEDLPYNYECSQILQQPSGPNWWSVWDAKWPEEGPNMLTIGCKSVGTFDPKKLEDAVNNNDVLEAQSIEELAQKMEVPPENFKATVARYTELARNGKDLDFGKHPGRLTTIEKPPYYACKMEVRCMVTLGGLKINSKTQVLDTDGNIITGLYAAGNVSGSFFTHQYLITLPGISHSRAWTFGRLAGINAAAEKA